MLIKSGIITFFCTFNQHMRSIVQTYVMSFIVQRINIDFYMIHLIINRTMSLIMEIGINVSFESINDGIFFVF